MTSSNGRTGGGTDTVFHQRVRAAGLSLWELGDLLGIHPHYLHPTTERLDSLPVAVLVDLARRLDMHPGDIAPQLDSVLHNARAPQQPDTDHAAPATDAALHEAADAELLLTTLAYAAQPLTVDDLAVVLGWTMQRVVAAIDHVRSHPDLTGPVALRSTAADAYTVTARLDRLTTEQRQRLGQAQLYRHPLTPDQAHMLLAALALNTEPDRYLHHRDQHPDAELDLKRAGLLHADGGPHRPSVDQDVRFSLRYFTLPTATPTH